MKDLYERNWGNLNPLAFNYTNKSECEFVGRVQQADVLVMVFDIFYIEIINRDIRYLHLSKRIKSRYGNLEEVISKLKWGGRLTNRQLLDILDNRFYIQLDKEFVIHQSRIVGVDKEFYNVNIQSVASTLATNGENFLTKELPVGSHYRKSLIKLYKQLDIRNVVLKNTTEEIRVFPSSIKFIKVERRKKTFCLSCPVSGMNGAVYKFVDTSNASIDTFLVQLDVFPFYKVSRNYYVNFSYVVGRDKAWEFILLNRGNDGQEYKVSISRRMRQSVMKIIADLKIVN